MFYVGHRQDDDEPDAPLLVVWNGDGAVTSIMGVATGPVTAIDRGVALDPPIANAHSWTRFADVLYLDPPGSGYGYLLEGRPRPELPADEAGEVLHAILTYLDCRARRVDQPVVLVAESRGGARAALVLWHLRQPDGGAAPMFGSSWTAEDSLEVQSAVRAHFARIGEARGEDSGAAGYAARQFIGQVLVQPVGPNWPMQLSAQGDTAEAASRCTAPPGGPSGDPFDLVAHAGRASREQEFMRAIFRVDLQSIAWMRPENRVGSRRPDGAVLAPHWMDTTLGPLGPLDAYQWGGTGLYSTGGDDPPEIFAENLRWHATIITHAQRDPLVFCTPAIPELLVRWGAARAASRRPGENVYDITLLDGTTRPLAIPDVDSRHIVAWDAPMALAEMIDSFITARISSP